MARRVSSSALPFLLTTAKRPLVRVSVRRRLHGTSLPGRRARHPQSRCGRRCSRAANQGAIFVLAAASSCTGGRPRPPWLEPTQGGTREEPVGVSKTSGSPVEPVGLKPRPREWFSSEEAGNLSLKELQSKIQNETLGNLTPTLLAGDCFSSGLWGRHRCGLHRPPFRGDPGLTSV